MIIGDLQLILNDMLKDFIGKKYDINYSFHEEVWNKVKDLLSKNELEYYTWRIVFEQEEIFNLKLKLENQDKRYKHKRIGIINSLSFELCDPELKSKKISDLKLIVETKKLEDKIDKHKNSIEQKRKEIEKMNQELIELQTDLMALNNK